MALDLASKTIAPKGRARPQDQGETDLCSLYAIANATVETLRKDNIVVAKLQQLDFVKVKDGHHVQEFNGTKLKILKDRETGGIIDNVTLEIKEHNNINPELLRQIKEGSIICVLDYSLQDRDGGRHCVFIDTVKTLNFFFQWIPWISKRFTRENFICINSWGNFDKNPKIEVYPKEKGNCHQVFEVNAIVQRLESEYQNADKNCALSIYTERNCTLWTLIAFLQFPFEGCNAVTNPSICHLYIMSFICTSLWVLLYIIHNHSLFWSKILKQSGKNKTTWKIIGAVVKSSIGPLFFVLASFFVFFLAIIISKFMDNRYPFSEPCFVILLNILIFLLLNQIRLINNKLAMIQDQPRVSPYLWVVFACITFLCLIATRMILSESLSGMQRLERFLYSLVRYPTREIWFSNVLYIFTMFR